MDEEDINSANFTLGWSYLNKPYKITGGSHKHEFYRIVFLPGGGPKNISDNDVEVEYS